MRRSEVIVMDSQGINRVLKNYRKRSKQLNQVWCNITSVKAADRQDLLIQQLILFNRVAMIYNVTVNCLKIMQRIGAVDSDMRLEYRPFLNNKAEPADNLYYIPTEDEKGIQQRLDSVIAKPLVIRVNKKS